MKSTKKTALPVMRDHMKFPRYFRKDGTYTELHSEKDYTQVQLLHTCTIITRGNNLHVLEALKQATEIEQEKYRMAFNNALSKIQL